MVGFQQGLNALACLRFTPTLTRLGSKVYRLARPRFGLVFCLNGAQGGVDAVRGEQMLIVTRETLRNPGVLETRSLPKKFFGRVQVIPRGGGAGLTLRLIFEMQFLRYLAALAPFAAIPFLSRDLALPITQAPIAMLMLIAIVEMKVLRLSARGRERLVDEDEAARRLDLFTFRARAVLRRIAARHGLGEGELALVAEQSELARVAPLTFVSVQTALPEPHLLDLDTEDRALIEAGLFDADLTERMLHAVNLREDVYLREARIEAAGVSAHARLAAALERGRAAPREAAAQAAEA